MSALDPERYDVCPRHLPGRRWLLAANPRPLRLAPCHIPRSTPGPRVLSDEAPRSAPHRPRGRSAAARAERVIRLPLLHGPFVRTSPPGMLDLADVRYVGPGYASAVMMESTYEGRLSCAGLPSAPISSLHREWCATPSRPRCRRRAHLSLLRKARRPASSIASPRSTDPGSSRRGRGRRDHDPKWSSSRASRAQIECGDSSATHDGPLTIPWGMHRRQAHAFYDSMSSTRRYGIRLEAPAGVAPDSPIISADGVTAFTVAGCEGPPLSTSSSPNRRHHSRDQHDAGFTPI